MKYFIDSSTLIYFVTQTPEDKLNKLFNLFKKLKSEGAEFYTNILVLDEVLWVCRKKYSIQYKDTIKILIELLSDIRILPLTEMDFYYAIRLLVNYNLKPSDAIHVANMLNNGIPIIISEDKEFDRIVKRIWIE